MKGRRVHLGAAVLVLLVALVAGSGLAQGPSPGAGPSSEEAFGTGASAQLGTGASAQLGTSFTYQGQLRLDGELVEMPCDFQFSLYDAPEMGSQVGLTHAQRITATAGLFTAQLDFGVGAFGGNARWLEIAVRCPAGSGGYTTLHPRQPLTASPYALALPGLWTMPNPLSPNLIGGYSGNSVSEGVEGGTISGGGFFTRTNQVSDNFGTVGGGSGNQAGDGGMDPDSAPHATVAGGQGNGAIGGHSTVGGGGQNIAVGSYATVAGGHLNDAGAIDATVGGGTDNQAGGSGAVVSGGDGNTAAGNYSTIGGGWHNQAGEMGATVGGGQMNQAGGVEATVGGGLGNEASGVATTVGGGESNWAHGDYATIGGGSYNNATVTGTTVAGGSDNVVTATYGTVGGGQSNAAGANHATVDGGYYNEASGGFSAVGGGFSNAAGGYVSTVGGGWGNSSSGWGSTTGGGEDNSAAGKWATVGGGYSNLVTATYTTVGGGYGNTASGEYATLGGGGTNTASGRAATVGGGSENEASEYYATVGGGAWNTASGQDATVGGGSDNTASGLAAVVPGGLANVATGAFSFAAGRWANANNQGCFVWGDSTAAVVACNDDNRTIFRSTGGFYIYTNNAATPSGLYLAAGGSSWNTHSDRNVKENFAAVDTRQLLARLAQVPISTWNYKAQDPTIRHVGPMAQDFNALLPGLGGEGETYINTLDADGVALAAIQGLYELSQEQAGRIVELEAENSALRQQLDDLDARVAALERAGGAAAGPAWPVGLLSGAGLLLVGLALALSRRVAWLSGRRPRGGGQ